MRLTPATAAVRPDSPGFEFGSGGGVNLPIHEPLPCASPTSNSSTGSIHFSRFQTDPLRTHRGPIRAAASGGSSSGRKSHPLQAILRSSSGGGNGSGSRPIQPLAVNRPLSRHGVAWLRAAAGLELITGKSQCLLTPPLFSTPAISSW
jgi:hypothetical protein